MCLRRYAKHRACLISSTAEQANSRKNELMNEQMNQIRSKLYSEEVWRTLIVNLTGSGVT